MGSSQTLANLTKSTVRRLLKDGTLRVEGYRPDWADPDLAAEEDAPDTSKTTKSANTAKDSTENSETE